MTNNKQGFGFIHLPLLIIIPTIIIILIASVFINSQNKSEKNQSQEIGEQVATDEAGLEDVNIEEKKLVPTNKVNSTSTPASSNNTNNPASSNSNTSNTTSGNSNSGSNTNPTSIPPTATTAPTIAPTSAPQSLDYQGDHIKVTTQCSGSSITTFIIDDGVDENPNGTWTYLISGGQYAYLAYTGPSGGNSSASIYGTANSIRGGGSITLQSNTSYTAGIAHGNYTTYQVPTLENPKYELAFQTPSCN